MSASDAEKLLTVVIPAYNVAPYISACIESVIDQAGCAEQLEIIIVVDGATDETESILRQTLTKYRGSFQIVLQNNSGLSSARNAGLRLTTTKYVTFLDGDDEWEADYLKIILPLLYEEGIDIVEYDAKYIEEFSKRGTTLKIASAPAETITRTTRDEFIERFLCYTWARVYRSELVRRREFPVGLRFEDSATTPWYYWHAQQQISVGRALIGYRQRPNSILKTPSLKDIEDLAKTVSDAATMYKETNSLYWQRVAHRAFQQACRRMTWQSPLTWSKSLRVIRSAIGSVPPPAGFSRWFQANATFSYTALLYLKRQLLE